MVAKSDECILCHPEGKIENMLKGYEYNRNSVKPWVFVPREPEAFGHLVVASGKHYADISDEKLTTDRKYSGQIISLINKLSVKMRKELEYEGRKCEKVYVSTLCETENMHLHFHLIPRFKGDKEGFMHLLGLFSELIIIAQLIIKLTFSLLKAY